MDRDGYEFGLRINFVDRQFYSATFTIAAVHRDPILLILLRVERHLAPELCRGDVVIPGKLLKPNQRIAAIHREHRVEIAPASRDDHRSRDGRLKKSPNGPSTRVAGMSRFTGLFGRIDRAETHAFADFVPGELVAEVVF